MREENAAQPLSLVDPNRLLTWLSRCFNALVFKVRVLRFASGLCVRVREVCRA